MPLCSLQSITESEKSLSGYKGFSGSRWILLELEICSALKPVNSGGCPYVGIFYCESIENLGEETLGVFDSAILSWLARSTDWDRR